MQRDYILRLIEQAGAALRALRARIMGREVDMATLRTELESMFEHTGLDSELALTASPDTLLMMVAPTGELDVTRAWILAESLYLLGLNAHLEQRYQEAEQALGPRTSDLPGPRARRRLLRHGRSKGPNHRDRITLGGNADVTSMPADELERCAWAQSDALEREYHDREWGVPVADDHVLFEYLTLEGAQAGLSWRTILGKRDGYRRAFKEFDPAAVARMRSASVERLVNDATIVRHRGKIESTLSNARRVLDVQKEYGSFATFVWSFVDGVPRQNEFTDLSELPTQTDDSRALSKALRKAWVPVRGSNDVLCVSCRPPGL